MDLYPRLYDLIAIIPAGSIASYGQVANAAGLARGARVVGWALGALPDNSGLPWQRVVAKGGRLSIVNAHVTPDIQRQALAEEGIECEERDGDFYVLSPSWHDFDLT